VFFHKNRIYFFIHLAIESQKAYFAVLKLLLTMLQGWMRKILLFSTSLVLLASCKDPEFSLDEPLVEEERSAIYINGQNNFLYALDPNTGERIWEHFF